MTDRLPDLDTPTPPLLPRRAVLRAAALGGLAAFLAACGSSPPPSPSASGVPPSGSGSTAPSVPSSAGPSGSPAPSASPSPSAAATPTRSPSPSASSDAALRRQIAGLLVVGFRGATLDAAPWVRTALRDDGLGGVILFDRDQLTGKARNVTSPAQVKRLTASLRAAGGSREIIVSVDQEGGVVTRLGPAHGFPPLASQATIGRGSAAEARSWASGMASTLATNGFDLNFAPVVDLNGNPKSPAIGALGRSFSADPDIVVQMAGIEIDALRRAGVRSTLKHFPGIGSSTANTDFGVVDVTKTWSRTELEPFRRLIADGHADLVMAGHVVNGQIDPDRPASLSRPTVTDLLRGQLGWQGIVVTDDLQAAAITKQFGRDEAILLALEAGDDLLLFANQQVYDPAIVSRVVDVVTKAVASGRIPRSRIAEASGRVGAMFG